LQLRNSPEVAAAAHQLLDSSEKAEEAPTGEENKDKRDAAYADYLKKRTAFLNMARDEESIETSPTERDSANHF